jgi:hypothetical protein
MFDKFFLLIFNQMDFFKLIFFIILLNYIMYFVTGEKGKCKTFLKQCHALFC